MLSRRNLLGAAACTLGLAMAGPVGAATTRRLKRFGIQLYTLRDVAASDPIGALRKLKLMGYSEVELGGAPYSTLDPKVLRRQLSRIGLTAPSMHVQMNELVSDAPKAFAHAKTLGCDYAVLPFIGEEYRSTIAQCRAFAGQLTRFGQMAKAEGLTFAYHNHAFEFEPVQGAQPFDVFFGESDPALVKIELDLHWAAKAKADIPAIFDKYAGRVEMCHVKDMTADGQMVVPGAGIMDFGSIFARSRQAGLVHYFVEHDNLPAPYWSQVAAASNYLKKLRF